MCNRQRDTLRTGITTGTCAAAAAKASAIFLVSGEAPNSVTVKNLEGREFSLSTFREGNRFTVIKDAGDDKSDVTDGAEISALVELADGENEIAFIAGEGVGTVTLPGLKIPVGQPAINPVPRKMIALAVREVIPKRSLKVTVSVKNGEELAKRTFNPRLGIVGGISILGTTGVVKPMNERAILDSLTLEMSMIRSLGHDEIFVTFAGTGEKIARRNFHIEGRNVIQCVNYPGHVLDEAERFGFTRVIICGQPGKLLKVTAGSFITHSKASDGRLEALCTHLALMGACQNVIASVYRSNTTSEAIEIIKSGHLEKVWDNIAEATWKRCAERVNKAVKIDVIFFDTEGKILGAYHDE